MFDQIRAGVLADRSQFFKDLSAPFYGANRPGAKVSQGCAIRSGCRACRPDTRAPIDCIKAFSETDFTEDLKKFDVPTLIIHGDDDQIVPMGASACFRPKMVKDPTLKIYPGAPHGLCFDASRIGSTRTCSRSSRALTRSVSPPPQISTSPVT